MSHELHCAVGSYLRQSDGLTISESLSLVVLTTGPSARTRALGAAELPPCLAERTLVVEPETSLDQRSNQAQEFLFLRSVASCDEKGSDLNVGDLFT